MSNYFVAWKYAGGTYCGNALCRSLDECMSFADDGFCDYVRVETPEGKILKIHFTPTEQ